MELETLKVNLLNIAALTLNLMPVERVIAVLVGVTALIYNILKIISWFKNRKLGN